MIVEKEKNYIDNDQIETFDTLNIDNEKIINEGSIYPMDIKFESRRYSVYEVYRKVQQGKIKLDPDFQRENVWKKKDESELIESILMGIPIPIFYVYENPQGELITIDGRQRITAIDNFLSGRLRLSSTLKVLTNCVSCKFDDISPRLKTKLEDTQLIFQVINPATPDKVMYNIFDRVNRAGKRINNQEMRNAIYQGKATLLLKQLVVKDYFKLATNNMNDNRMQGRYFILRFIAFYLYNEGKLYKGEKRYEYRSDMEDFLATTMLQINESDDEELMFIKNSFKKSMKTVTRIFNNFGFRIVIDDKKTRIMMTLFESLSYAMTLENDFSDKEIRKRFNQLLDDVEFIKSLRNSVDSRRSVEARFEKVISLVKGGKQNDKKS